MVVGHVNLIPTDRDQIPIPHGCHACGRTVVVISNGLQVWFCVIDCGYVTYHVYDGWRHPAEIIQLIKFDV